MENPIQTTDKYRTQQMYSSHIYPVSYTHLDVYKRQLLHTTIEKLFQLALSSFTAHRQIGIERYNVKTIPSPPSRPTLLTHNKL